MGKPAARVGDMMIHGGTIVGPGAPMVLIGGMPAALVGDNHVCPMVTPGTPPVPHVGGPILPPGAPMVLISGKPAACVGDMATCTGPPDTIAPPGCPTVLIGSGGGGGGGGAGSGGGGAKAQAADSKVDDSHYLDVKFADKGGKPITGVGYSAKGPDGSVTDGAVTGQVKKSGVPQGNYEITLRAIIKAEWSKKSAVVGDKVDLKVETSGIDSGEKAELEIFVRDSGHADRLLTTLPAQVQGDKIQVQWELKLDDNFLKIQQAKEEKGSYSSPTFYYMVKAAGISGRSKVLEYKDYIELELKDEDGKPAAGAGYKIFLPNGAVKEGTLDSNGYAKVDKISPGKVNVTFDIRKCK